MKTLTAKEMVLVQDYYFFTLDDFRPRRVGDDIKLRNNNIDLGYLRENGALFETKEDAINAGNAIRSFLLGNQLSLVPKELHRKYNRLTPGEVSQVFRNLLEETLNDDCKHTQSACACHKDVENDSPRTVLIKIFHP